MKNQIAKFKKFASDHSSELIAGTAIVAGSALVLTAAIVVKRFNNEMWVDAMDFIESKGLESEFLDHIIKD